MRESKFDSIKLFFTKQICLLIWIGVSQLGIVSSVVAQDPTPIWSAETLQVSSGSSAGDCYFRKKFTLAQPEVATMELGQGGDFELYINDKLAHRSSANRNPITLDVASFLLPGVNLVAVKVRHASSLPIGFQAKLRVRETGETRFRVLATNETWKVRSTPVEGWNKSSFDDLSWINASSTNQTEVTKTVPRTPTKLASARIANSGNGSAATTDPRFSIDPEFNIEEVMTPEETGSLIALEFNEFGQLILSKEGGALMIANLDKPVGDPDRIRIYCDQVNTCQGILPLNGDVFVTGMGPEGLGLYRLTDQGPDGEVDVVKKIVGFTGGLGEHGPHGIQLGPDGMLYVILGNGTQVEEKVASTSPYRHWYEGDLIPRYEDPGGHAVGVKAPGGTIIRLNLDGTKVERYAGGIRNAYDLVFDDQGELIVHDSDMESDAGAPWYRPNNVFHVPAGAELGWRSGWSNFPQHGIDHTPPLCGTGRGSPTGAVLYQHIHFPARYHDTVFLADWSEGKILTLHKQPSGSGFRATTEVFLSGKPLNVCDLTVGEDGGLYFCTGGRGTSGGVFRVSWTGRVPQEILQFDTELAKVIRHPQPNSAWGRQNLAQLSAQFGTKWGSSLEGVAKENRNSAKFRIRSLQLMALYGPVPSIELLTSLASDKDHEVRAEIARLGGLNGTKQVKPILAKLLTDDHSRVRRIAGEAWLRLESPPKLDSLTKLLSSEDRIESTVGRRLLERIPPKDWEEKLLQTPDNRLFINSAIALLTAEPTLERSYRVLARCSEIFEGYVNDIDFLDMLRVTQLALFQGKVDPEKVPGLVDRIGSEFPSGNSIVNQELVRIMAYLKIGNADGRVEEYLNSKSVPVSDRIHSAMYLQHVGEALPPSTRLAIIDCLETNRNSELSAGFKLYIKRSIEDAAKTLTPDQVETVIANGARWPNAVIPAFYQLPVTLNESTRDQVIKLDKALVNKRDAVSDQLRLGIIAILARSGDSNSMEYLRQTWVDEVDRRKDIAIGLAQQPEGENWPYLVSSLGLLDDLTGREIVQKLLNVDRKPAESPFFRDLILLGYRMRNAGALEASRLMQSWTDVSIPNPDADWESQLDNWRKWFAQTFPDEVPIEIAGSQPVGKHSVHGLVSYLEKHGLGDRSRGQILFQSTQCATCHRQGTIGENIGPDLTNLAQRFSLRETIEATIDPSANIPDRYSSKVIITKDGDQHSGMAIKQANGEYLVLRSDGKRIRVLSEEIEDIRDSDVSAMPANLLDSLSVSEVADLMAFLMNSPDRIAEAESSSNR